MTSRVVSLLERAHEQDSITALENLVCRARFRASTYARLLSDWPALVADAAREAEEIEKRLLEVKGEK